MFPTCGRNGEGIFRCIDMDVSNNWSFKHVLSNFSKQAVPHSFSEVAVLENGVSVVGVHLAFVCTLCLCSRHSCVRPAF